MYALFLYVSTDRSDECTLEIKSPPTCYYDLPFLRSAVAQLVEGCQLEPHHGQSHCVVSLSKTLYPLLSTGSTNVDLS